MASCSRNIALRWRHNGRDCVSDHQTHDCLLNRLYRRRSRKTSKFRVIGLCVGNSPVTSEFLEQRAIKAENVSIWWHHHGLIITDYITYFKVTWCNKIWHFEVKIISSSMYRTWKTIYLAHWIHNIWPWCPGGIWVKKGNIEFDGKTFFAAGNSPETHRFIYCGLNKM